MSKLERINSLRTKLKENQPSIGTWIQIPNGSTAEILGNAGYDWVAVDMEHGSISTHQLPGLFRAIESGGTLPLVRLAQGAGKDCKRALDAGAAGVIIPMVESAAQLREIISSCCWPPAGQRGVGFSRANLFGKFFEQYSVEAQQPIIVAMIENIHAVTELPEILAVAGLDALFIGPYDLSASMGITAAFDNPEFQKNLAYIKSLCLQQKIPCGIHVVQPNPDELKSRINEGYRFLAYSLDSVILRTFSENPLSEDK